MMTLWSWEWWLAIGSMGMLMLVGLLLMIVILLQRGRGGGLAGAFGGAGGQSAFGTRAGDVFTKITAVMAILWVFLAGVSRFALEPAANQRAATFQSQQELDAKRNTGASIESKTSEEEGAANTEDGANTEDEAPAKTENE